MPPPIRSGSLLSALVRLMVEFLPKALQHTAVYLPPYHLSRLALGVLGVDQDHVYWNHWQALVCFTAIFLGLAMVGYRRDNARQNGLA